jgi:hypothetical protein
MLELLLLLLSLLLQQSLLLQLLRRELRLKRGAVDDGATHCQALQHMGR